MPSPIIATPAYQDARGAIDFLVTAFGFDIHAWYEADDGTLVHAELTLGDAMLMPAVPDQGEYGELLRSVEAAGGPTGGSYVVVDEVDAHHSRAERAGARILFPPREREHGGREYTCRDPEGHLWTFGTYDPWAVTPGDG